MALSARLLDSCGCRRSALVCSYDLQQLSSFVLRCHPQKLMLHNLPPVVPTSSLSFSQTIRERTCLEFTSPVWNLHRKTKRLVCFAGGGKRPRRPRIWKTRQRRGSFNKSDRLLESLQSVSNVKEEVYGVLDQFVAWELDFPLIAVKKALYVLQIEKNWPRIIQIVKWMLGKGQGRTLNTYHMLLKAFCEEGRIEEAQETFQKVFTKNLECTPLKLFSEMMRMYERHEMYEDILEVFADMEELEVRLDAEITGIVTRTYEKIGDMDRALRVLSKYGAPKYRWRTINGLKVKFRNVDKDSTVSRWRKDGGLDSEVKSEGHSHEVSESSHKRTDNDTGIRDHHNTSDDQGGREEDERDDQSKDEEELEVEELDEDAELDFEEPKDQLDADHLANEVYFRHFRLRQTSENEMFV